MPPKKVKRGRSRRRAAPKKSKSSDEPKPGTSRQPSSPLRDRAEPALFVSPGSDPGIPADQHAETLLSQHTADDVFDKLLGPDYKSPFAHRSKIKTYSNRNRTQRKPCEDRILEFHDCKNRDSIVRWLNDNRNVFDRLTQTQSEQWADEGDEEVPPTLDMPSVSQIHSRPPAVAGGRKRTQRSPNKPRARSLDIHVTRGKRGRVGRHSLAGDTPTMENYEIEPCTEERETPEDAKLLLDLIEDVYLNSIEEEMAQQRAMGVDAEEGRGKDASGWSRMRKMRKSVKKARRTPKSLDITLQATQTQSKREGAGDGEGVSFDHDVVEKYLAENIEHVEERKEEISPCCRAHKTPNEVASTPISKRSVIDDAVDKGKNLLESLKALSNQDFDAFSPIFREIKAVFAEVSSCLRDAETQTLRIDGVHEGAQTEGVSSREVETQTEDLVTGSSTPSDLMVEEDNYKMAGTLDFVYFDTEEAVKHETDGGSEQKEVQASRRSESLLVCSMESARDPARSLKRARSDSDEDSRGKRPCNKFMPEDLSVAFDSCSQEASERPKSNGGIFQLTEGSEGVDYDELLAKMLKKYDDEGREVEPEKKPTRTQELIEECDVLIHNAAKPKEQPLDEQRASGCSEEVFAGNSLFMDEENLGKIEKDIDEARGAISTKELVETASKKSRRSLFGRQSKGAEKFSDSPFALEFNRTRQDAESSGNVNDVTLTQDNIDRILRGINSDSISMETNLDEQVAPSKDESKIKILQNVVIKSRNQDGGVDDDETGDEMFYSDVDVVETTPQKNIPKYSDQRGHQSLLDITLPPPLEFQDAGAADENDASPNDVTAIDTPQYIPRMRPRRPLSHLNRPAHSTPHSHKPDSEKLSLSPIAVETGRVPGPIELARRAQFTPLAITGRPSQRGTPKQKSILSYVRASQGDAPSSPATKPCIACTRISKDQVIAISSLTNKKLATYSTAFTAKVTHLIVSVDEKNCIKDHTIKFVSAVAAGIWVLGFKWIQECLAKNCIVPEEPYEALDVSGADGPRQARLTRSINPLFGGYKIHAAPPFVSTTSKDVEDVIEMLGGTVASTPDELLQKDGFICVIITEARATQDFELYETWLETLKVVTVDIEWLSRSVGQYKLLSLRPFALCSDDSIESLGYPPGLLISVPFSFSQNTYNEPLN